MHQVIIGPKNQVVIPKEVRKKLKGLKPGSKAYVYPIDETTVGIKVADNPLQKYYGILGKATKKKSMIRELEKIRNEWK